MINNVNFVNTRGEYTGTCISLNNEANLEIVCL